VIGVGVNFSSETKNIEDWVVEELGWKVRLFFRTAQVVFNIKRFVKRKPKTPTWSFILCFPWMQLEFNPKVIRCFNFFLDLQKYHTFA
jgi:hypothetical protein